MGAKSLLAALAVPLVSASVAFGADPLDPKVKITKSDQAHATAALLVRDDLGPAWAGGVRKPQAFKTPVCPAHHPDSSDLTITGHAEAVYDNGNGGIQIDSDVQILKNAKQVDTLFSRILNPKLATCLKYDLLKSLPGVDVIIEKVARLDLAKVGTHSALFRLSLIVKTGKTSVGVLSDFMFLAQGRTEWFVNVVAPASVESELPALESRIARTLVKRAEV